LAAIPGTVCCDIALIVTRLGAPYQFVHLREVDGNRWLNVWIHFMDAAILLGVIKTPSTPLPMMFDTMSTLGEELGGHICHAVLEDIETSRASIVLKKQNGSASIKARICDAMCLAVRTKAPIFAVESQLTHGWAVPNMK
jgi:bifunctional DNase/RNase